MVTFETKCYENDWEFILKGSYLRQMIARCNYPFSHRVVMINNVRNKSKVCRYADKKIREGVIDAYYIVDDYAKTALEFFEIRPGSFHGGYYYSIAELVSIYLCNTEYLIHFSGDSFPDDNQSTWISDAINIFSERSDIVVANANWDKEFILAAEESFDSINDFFLGFGFSDQCYLIRTKDFRKPIYNEHHEVSVRYPEYGGELFEKRVDSYMRNHNLYRLTSKKSSYTHRNFPNNKWERLRVKWNLFFAGRRSLPK